MSTRLLESGDTLLIENGSDFRLLEDGDTTVIIGTVQYRFGRARKSYEFGKITKEPT